MRISDKSLSNLIRNNGTIDGIRVPNATGILRLALDLKEAREKLAEVKKQMSDEKS